MKTSSKVTITFAVLGLMADGCVYYEWQVDKNWWIYVVVFLMVMGMGGYILKGMAVSRIVDKD